MIRHLIMRSSEGYRPQRLQGRAGSTHWHLGGRMGAMEAEISGVEQRLEGVENRLLSIEEALGAGTRVR